MKELSATELAEASRSTVDYYDDSAASFWQGTRDHDVSQNLNALLSAIDRPAPLKILDFGCGPGRDLAALKTLGHTPTGLDGAARFCQMARAYTGCRVYHQNFLDLRLPASDFDGIFANASLFHVPGQALPQVLRRLYDALRPGGVLFSSVPRGPGTEGYNGARYGFYHGLSGWQALMEGAGFAYIDHYYRPTGLPREQQPWLASTWRRP